eukprot:3491270-Rhodomonas_salina.1
MARQRHPPRTLGVGPRQVAPRTDRPSRLQPERISTEVWVIVCVAGVCFNHLRRPARLEFKIL